MLPLDMVSEDKKANLKRKIYPMPDYVKKALEDEDLMEVYHDRPGYQQNDYIGWIARAKRPETRQKRLDQMIDELKGGNVYMKMDYKPGVKS